MVSQPSSPNPYADRWRAERSEHCRQPVQHDYWQCKRSKPIRLGQLRPGHDADPGLHQWSNHGLRAAIHPDHYPQSRPAKAARVRNQGQDQPRQHGGQSIRQRFANTLGKPGRSAVRGRRGRPACRQQDLRQDQGTTDRAGIEKAMMDSYNRICRADRAGPGNQPRRARPVAAVAQGYAQMQATRDDSRAEQARQAYLASGNESRAAQAALQRRRHPTLQHEPGGQLVSEQSARRPDAGGLSGPHPADQRDYRADVGLAGDDAAISGVPGLAGRRVEYRPVHLGQLQEPVAKRRRRSTRASSASAVARPSSA